MDESDKLVSSDSSFGEVLVEIGVELEMCRFLVVLELVGSVWNEVVGHSMAWEASQGAGRFKLVGPEGAEVFLVGFRWWDSVGFRWWHSGWFQMVAFWLVFIGSKCWSL